jgi:membrane protein YqaA with SNARE-associated domain
VFLSVLFAGSWGYSVFAFFRRLGAGGLFLLGILDSSFLFLPFGNDVLLIALVSSNREGPKWILYVLMSSLGSVIGVLLIDLMMRKAGEQGLEKFVKPKKIESLKHKMEKRAGWVIFWATLMPPPFPFTAVVMTAAALQFSRKKILLAVFVGRFIRFTLESLLAIYFGRQVLKFMSSEVVEYFVYGFLIMAVVGSVYSIRKWVTSRKSPQPMRPREAAD